jgi:hypothetical protein
VGSVGRNGHYFATRITTGPQDLLLMLDLSDERIPDPFVSAIDICPMYGRPTDEVVRNAVLAGTDRANAEFGTSWHPLEIRFSYSGWNNEQCSIAGWAAYNIVRAVVQGTVAGPEEKHD